MVERLRRVVKDRKLWVLLLILGIGAYLRLWHIEHLVNAFHDYEPAVYMLDARSIAEGYLPYRDFVLVHPPLYELLLAGVIKVFGYSFFLGKYVSVFFSLGSIVLIYLVGKKLLNSGTGLIAAALFAVSPDMVYNGARAVQEALGLFLVLLGGYFAADFLATRKGKVLFLAGIALGLAVATKYTFIPAFLGILFAILLVMMGESSWEPLRRLTRPYFLIVYLALTGSLVGFLFILARALDLPVPVPFFFNTYVDVGRPIGISVTVLSLALPLFLTILLMERRFPARDVVVRLWQVMKQKEVWLIVAGAVVGFIVITGFFWVKTPREFLDQTVMMQNRYLAPGIPSMVMMVHNAFASTEFVGVAYIPVLLALPLAFIMLNKQSLSRPSAFLSGAILMMLLFCQSIMPDPRYYVSVYPFFLLGLGSMVPFADGLTSADLRSLGPAIKASVLSILGLFVLFVGVSTALLTHYTGYDLAMGGVYTSEGVRFLSDNETEYVYRQTVAYLESVSPNKVWALNPIYTAMSSRLTSTLDADTTALVWLKNESPEQVVKEKMDEGVDYVVLDYWVRYFQMGNNPELAWQLAEAVRSHSHIVKVIGNQFPMWTEIYKLNRE